MTDRIRSTDNRTKRPTALHAVSTAIPAAPAGQIPADVTAAFLAFITALDAQTPGAPTLTVTVTDPHTGETTNAVPVTEDTVLALLAAHSSAVRVRPTGTAPAECEGEPEPQHTRPAWLPDADETARAVTRLRGLLAPVDRPAPVQAPVIAPNPQPQPAETPGEQRRTVAHTTLRVVRTKPAGGAQ